jgi:carbon monoxide dehydrogenase subunit G
MEFENTFEVQAPVGEVWDLLMDVERIAPCMPGAQVLEQTGEDAYKVAVKVRLGPMSMLYTGDVEIVSRDEEAHEASMQAKAKESRGQGTASAQIRMALHEQNGGTAASIVTEMQMSGKAAAMGQGVIKDVAGSLTDTFARNLAAMVSGPAPATEPEPEQPSAGAAPASPRQDPPVREAPEDASLPVGQIARSVVAGRLQDPRARTIAGGLLALLILRLGIAIGRRG